MKKSKLKILIIFGGKSAEHEVSLQSAKNIIEALDKDKYEPVLASIDKLGKWHYHDSSSKYLLNPDSPGSIALGRTGIELSLTPGGKFQLAAKGKKMAIDAAFPILHGKLGEDGTMQGLLEILGVPFVGSGVLGSSVGMDKDVAKRLWRDAGLPIAKFLSFSMSQRNSIDYSKVHKTLGSPLFIKPANAGSSVGVSKVKDEKEFKSAVNDAFKYDDKILVEESINGREIEVGVLGNSRPIASVPGEIIPRHEFYSYEAKYLDENGAVIQIPAKLDRKLVKKIQAAAVNAFEIIGCKGMARVDFFVTPRGKYYLNEINTIPGFTNISMYPKLWEASGLEYAKLIDRLIELAIERFDKEKKLKTAFK